jgi:hypothetical protein
MTFQCTVATALLAKRVTHRFRRDAGPQLGLTRPGPTQRNRAILYDEDERAGLEQIAEWNAAVGFDPEQVAAVERARVGANR